MHNFFPPKKNKQYVIQCRKKFITKVYKLFADSSAKKYQICSKFGNPRGRPGPKLSFQPKFPLLILIFLNLLFVSTVSKFVVEYVDNNSKITHKKSL